MYSPFVYCLAGRGDDSRERGGGGGEGEGGGGGRGGGGGGGGGGGERREGVSGYLGKESVFEPRILRARAALEVQPVSLFRTELQYKYTVFR